MYCWFKVPTDVDEALQDLQDDGEIWYTGHLIYMCLQLEQQFYKSLPCSTSMNRILNDIKILYDVGPNSYWKIVTK
jgi:hypothetical protein